MATLTGESLSTDIPCRGRMKSGLKWDQTGDWWPNSGYLKAQTHPRQSATTTSVRTCLCDEGCFEKYHDLDVKMLYM